MRNKEFNMALRSNQEIRWSYGVPLPRHVFFHAGSSQYLLRSEHEMSEVGPWSQGWQIRTPLWHPRMLRGKSVSGETRLPPKRQTRKQEQKLYMEDLSTIVDMAQDAGFLTHAKIDLVKCAYEYQYLYVFIKPS